MTALCLPCTSFLRKQPHIALLCSLVPDALREFLRLTILSSPEEAAVAVGEEALETTLVAMHQHLPARRTTALCNLRTVRLDNKEHVAEAVAAPTLEGRLRTSKDLLHILLDPPAATLCLRATETVAVTETTTLDHLRRPTMGEAIKVLEEAGEAPRTTAVLMAALQVLRMVEEAREGDTAEEEEEEEDIAMTATVATPTIAATDLDTELTLAVGVRPRMVLPPDEAEVAAVTTNYAFMLSSWLQDVFIMSRTPSPFTSSWYTSLWTLHSTTQLC